MLVSAAALALLSSSNVAYAVSVIICFYEVLVLTLRSNPNLKDQ